MCSATEAWAGGPIFLGRVDAQTRIGCQPNEWRGVSLSRSPGSGEKYVNVVVFLNLTSHCTVTGGENGK